MGDMEWYQWIGVVGGMLALPGAIGLAWAIVRGSFNKARVAELREDNDDLRKRNNDVDTENAGLKLMQEASEAKIAQQAAEIALITSMLTQKAEVGVVLEVLNKHHDEAEQHWQTMEADLAKLVRRSDENHGN